MKLWFKIFITSVLLVIAAVNITATVILARNRTMTLDRERNNAATDHEFICASLKNTIAYERLKNDAFMMTEDKIAAIAEKIISGWQDENRSAFLYDETGRAIGSELMGYSFEKMMTYIDDDSIIISEIADTGEKSYIISGSALILEGQNYILFSIQDITEIYLTGDRELVFSQIVSVICAAVIAAVLLFVTKLFLRPLENVRNTLSSIAQGDYSQRLTVKGSEELKSLAYDVNTMANSVEENYHKVSDLAEERKQFIDSLSHEIKTPLTSILGFADILRIKRDLTKEELTEYATIIVEEATRLRSLSGKLMELVSTGNTPLTRKPVELKEMLSEIAAVFEPIVKEKQVQLMMNSESLMIAADRDLFKSLIYNLIDNAVKASPIGSTVTVSCCAKKEKAQIVITDQGKGITKEELDHVFEPFYMADKSRSRKLGGAGLGLALCAEIARKHGAKISLSSEPASGTKAVVSIRLLKEGENIADIT